MIKFDRYFLDPVLVQRRIFRHVTFRDFNEFKYDIESTVIKFGGNILIKAFSIKTFLSKLSRLGVKMCLFKAKKTEKTIMRASINCAYFYRSMCMHWLKYVRFK